MQNFDLVEEMMKFEVPEAGAWQERLAWEPFEELDSEAGEAEK